MDTSDPGIECDVRTLTTGVVEVTVRQGRAAWLQVASRLQAARAGYLLANFRKANLPLPNGVLPEADCFSGAPAEIRDTDSMHVFTLDCRRPKASLVDTLADADAGMTIFSDHDTERLMIGQQILWAWFARPTLLVNQLTHGSTDLAARLLELPQIVLIEAPSGSLSLFAVEALATEAVAIIRNRGAGSH
jgi:hypothetical protein